MSSSSAGLSSRLSTHRWHSIIHLIEPAGPPNWKLKRNFQTTYSNLPSNIRRSQRLILSGQSQSVNRVARWGGITQFGNAYLGKPVNLNYLGKMEGQKGGGGSPPKNVYD